MRIFEIIMGCFGVIIFISMLVLGILLATYNDTNVSNTYQVEITILQVRLHNNNRNWVVVGADSTSDSYYFEIGLLELNTAGEKAILTYEKTLKVFDIFSEITKTFKTGDRIWERTTYKLVSYEWVV